jgi:hypothetical protein
MKQETGDQALAWKIGQLRQPSVADWLSAGSEVLPGIVQQQTVADKTSAAGAVQAERLGMLS